MADDAGGLPSCFCDLRWILSSTGSAFRVVVADGPLLGRVDRCWPRLRGPRADNWHWQWRILAASGGVVFAVVDEAGDPVTLWRAWSSRERYSLENIEVHPLKQRIGLGVLTLGLICRHALSCGCTETHLRATPGAVAFYEAAGAEAEAGNRRDDLVVMKFGSSIMRELRESVDEYLER